jgi:hypothetical protein
MLLENIIQNFDESNDDHVNLLAALVAFERDATALRRRALG